MARSKKKTPIVGICGCRSEKSDKQGANRRLRRRVRNEENLLEREEEIEDLDGKDISTGVREVSNVWCFGKDGKQWLPPENRKRKWLAK